jgi:chitinase
VLARPDSDSRVFIVRGGTFHVGPSDKLSAGGFVAIVPPAPPTGPPSSRAAGSPSASASDAPTAGADPSASAGPSASDQPAGPAATVVNGGFESGALEPWTCTGNLGRIISSPVRSGGHALSGSPTSSDNAQCQETVAVQPGHSYRLSGAVRGAYVYLGVSGAQGGDQSTWTPQATSYVTLAVPFTAGPRTTSVTVWVHGWYQQGTYQADDITIN